MNCTIPYNFRLVSRNEGKIKSYESCLDIRAWNHDACVRGGHLRAWIRHDMPCCVIPITTLTAALRIMGCKSHGRLTPRCHANCKSKVLLESICVSCQSIKECLKSDPQYEKFFIQEEFETSNWPCERCLDALKGVKFLWKIILEKILRINVPKPVKILNDLSSNLLTTTKSWKSEILHEITYLKNMMPLLNENEKISLKDSFCQCCTEVTITSRPTIPDNEATVVDCNNEKGSVLRKDSESYTVIPKPSKKQPKVRVSRSVSVKIKKVDIGCETTDLEEDQEFKNNINNMQHNLNELMIDLERLKKENVSLKMELQSVYNETTMKSHLYDRIIPTLPTHDILACLPKPFDDEHEIPTVVDGVASEMIITMKNCRNTSYKQVSVLQVMHKSNKPFFTNSKTDSSCKKEDPIQILDKLTTTFKDLVKREVNIVNKKKSNDNPSLDVKASYHKYNKKDNPPLFQSACEEDVLFTKQCDCSKTEEI